MSRRDSTLHFVLVFSFILFLITVVKNAWIAERAYINFRVIENWVHGFGLGFNAGERVLPISQPLWPILLGSMYWLATSILRIPSLNLLYYLSISISVILTGLAVGLLLKRVSHNAFLSLFIISGLLLSKAFVDFSTSGLENPLIHLLLLLFFLAYLRLRNFQSTHYIQWLLLTTFLSLLIVILQWELLFLVGFGLLNLAIRLRNEIKLWISTVATLLPLGLYILIVTFLYGSPLPNMYVARINAGVGWGRLIRQGVMYLLNHIDFDPLSILMLAVGLLAVFVVRKRSLFPFVFGILGSLATVVITGGDSLSGRLISPLVFMSGLLLSEVEFEFTELGQAALIIVIAFGVVTERSPIRSNLTYQNTSPDHRGIFDGRGVDFQVTGLLRLNRDSIYPPGSEWAGDDWFFADYTDVIILEERNLGFEAYQHGPETYILSSTGIADPLLARLPTVDPIVWDLFSLERKTPKNFDVVVLGDPHDLACEGLTDYYSDLRMVVSRPVFEKGRLIAFWRTISQKPSRSVFETCR